jgi:ABC-type Na+ efflux pump permease subunit
MNRRAVRAIFRKEMREFRRNKQIIASMALSPIGFVTAPVITLFAVNSSDLSLAYNYPVLLFTLTLAAMVPVMVGAYSIAGEREQGTLEPLLGTPIRTSELMLGKAMAIFVPGVAESYLLFGVIDCIVWICRPAVVTQIELRPYILVAQLLATPLLVALAVWLSMMISARVSDPRAASQLSSVVSLPIVAIGVCVGFHVIPVSVTLGILILAALLAVDTGGLWLVSKIFNREQLILGTR